MTLFYAVGHWNSYFQAMIYLNSKSKFPLQVLLREIIVAGQYGGGIRGPFRQYADYCYQLQVRGDYITIVPTWMYIPSAKYFTRALDRAIKG